MNARDKLQKIMDGHKHNVCVTSIKTGPDHNPVWTVRFTVTIDLKEFVAVGVADTKREAINIASEQIIRMKNEFK